MLRFASVLQTLRHVFRVSAFRTVIVCTWCVFVQQPSWRASFFFKQPNGAAAYDQDNNARHRRAVVRNRREIWCASHDPLESTANAAKCCVCAIPNVCSHSAICALRPSSERVQFSFGWVFVLLVRINNRSIECVFVVCVCVCLWLCVCVNLWKYYICTTSVKSPCACAVWTCVEYHD